MHAIATARVALKPADFALSWTASAPRPTYLRKRFDDLVVELAKLGADLAKRSERVVAYARKAQGECDEQLFIRRPGRDNRAVSRFRFWPLGHGRVC